MSIHLEDAQSALLNRVGVMPEEKIDLAEAWQRVSARAVVSYNDFPPFDRSPLDGYAVVADEVVNATADNPVTLCEVGNVPAGSVSEEPVRRGTACRIMTGAPMPQGATGVVRLEDTEVTSGRVQIFSGVGAKKNICFRGEEIVTGAEVLSPGELINMGAMGMLALVGDARPTVYARPRVAIISTGSELVSVEEELSPGKIRNSNSYMIAAQVRAAGGEPVICGATKDDVDEIIAKVNSCKPYDMCVTTGGASVGDHDLIEEVWRKIGVDVLFTRVSMKPGMPVVAGLRAGVPHIGLSGNPAAAAMAFEQLLRPVVLKMCGRKDLWRPRVRAKLSSDFCKKGGSIRFVWANFWQGSDGLLAEPLSLQGNGMLSSAITANAIIVVPPDSPPLAKGSEVEVMLLLDRL